MARVHFSTLFWKLVLPIPVALTFVIVLTVLFLPGYFADSARQDAVHSAKQTANQFKVLRAYYTNNVIKKILNESRLKPSIFHKDMEDGIPLPATFIHDMSELIAKEDIRIKLTSPYPFPNRKTRELDDFQMAAWNFLKENPEDIFVRMEMQNEREFVRVGVADTMVAQACVDCHNSRADTPKNDWQLGELRGVLEIDAAIDTQLARGARTSQVVVIGTVIIGIILMLVAAVTARQISKPIDTMTDIMRNMATGDTDLLVPAQNRKDEVGAIARAIEVFRLDIIEKNRLEEERNRAEIRFRDFAASASDWYWETDEHLRFNWLSDKYQTITGIDPENLMGKTREDFLEDDFDKSVWQGHLETLKKREPFRDFEYRAKIKGPKDMIIRTNGVPFFDANGKFAGYRGSASDVTAAKDAMLVAETSKILAEIIESSPIGVGISRVEDSSIMLMNSSGANILGYETSDEILGKSEQDNWVSLGLRDEFLEEFNRTGNVPARELQLKNVKDELFWCYLSWDQITFENEECYLFWIYDTTDLKKIQRQLFDSEKLASLGALVAGVAHEINTPIGVGITATTHLLDKFSDIQGNLEAGKLGRRKLEKFLTSSHDALDIVYSNLQSAVNLVQSFKEVSVDQASEEPREIVVSHYFQTIIHSLNPKIKKSRAEVNLNCLDDCSLFTYPGAISQVITNLILNSIIHGFGERKGGAIDITVSANPISGMEIKFEDDGVGIPDDIIAKVLDPFFTTKRGSGGSGLGLSIVHNIVTQKLDGTLTLKSELKEGVIAYITIPALKADRVE